MINNSRYKQSLICIYPLKNPWKREESLLGILSLESQTSFSCK